MGFVENLHPLQMQTIEERMRPGGWSSVGFLTESQSLQEVAQQDRAALEEEGTTFEQFARYFESIAEAYEVYSQGGKTLPFLDKKFYVYKFQTRGYQVCPFTQGNPHEDDCGRHAGSSDYILIHADTKKCLKIASLMPHLIRDHHFFQGGAYRVDPREALDFFGKASLSGSNPIAGMTVQIQHAITLDDRLIIYEKKTPAENPNKPAEKAESVLERYSITPIQVADRLGSLAKKAARLKIQECLNETFVPLIEGRYLVKSYGQKTGKCNCKKTFQFGNVVVTDIKTSQRISFSSLLPHIITEHHKFPAEGEFRIDADEAVKFFDLKKDTPYSYQTESFSFWERDCFFYQCKANKEDLQFVTSSNAQYFNPSPGINAYVFEKKAPPSQESTGSKFTMLHPGTYLYLANTREQEDNDVFDCRRNHVEIGGSLFKDFFPPGSCVFHRAEEQRAVLGPEDRLVEAFLVVFSNDNTPIFLKDYFGPIF